MLTTVIVIVIVAASIAAFLYARRSGETRVGTPAADAGYSPRSPYREFHVEGESAAVYFDVPLPAGKPDPVLSDLLLHEAVEVLREKQSHHLPMEHVTEIKAYGLRDGADALVGSLPLESPGSFPELEHTEVVPHYSSVPFDPLAHLGEMEHPPPSGSGAGGLAAAPADSGGLSPLADELTLTGRVEAGLRSQGVDPLTMSAGDLALGLMRLAGYSIQDAGRAGTYIVSTPGQRTYLQVVSHGEGDYPELDEHQMKEFQIGMASSGADRGMLVTEKYGPYMVYDAERRNPKCRFVTRERLQDFVDSFSMG